MFTTWNIRDEFPFSACEDFIATVTFIRGMNFKISVVETWDPDIAQFARVQTTLETTGT